MWKKVIIPPHTPILQAINIIDQSALQIALVVNENGQLLGTVTDGDIRRAILQHLSLDEMVGKIMNPNPSFVFLNESSERSIMLMRNRKLRHIPILDENRRVVGLDFAEELWIPRARNNWVILMAGGKGSRLKPMTDSCPKPLIKIGNKPVLETILDSFIEQGFTHFYFSVNYKAEMIIKYFGDGSHWGVEIKYLHEDEYLGTVGAISLLTAKPQEPLLLMNGDILTKTSYNQLINFHEKGSTAATICIKEQLYQIPYGVITIHNNRLKKIDEKPVQRFFINAGLYVFNPEVLDYIPSNTCFDIPYLLQILLEKGKEVAVFPIREYWIDIGQYENYEKANNEFFEVFG